MPLSLHCYFLCVSSPFSQIASTVGFVFSVAGKSSRKWTMRCFDGVVTVVDADNDAHGKYLLSFQNLSGIYNKRRGRISLPRRNFPSEIAAVLSVKTGDRLSKPYRQWWKFTLQQKSASCFSAGCAQNRLWIFSGKWDKFGTFFPKMACFLQFYIVATAQN